MKNTVPEHRWRAVTDATVTSSRADCGHPTSHQRIANAAVYLRTETAGGQVEVWSICIGCSTPDDYRYVPGTSQPPTRTRYETL